MGNFNLNLLAALDTYACRIIRKEEPCDRSFVKVGDLGLIPQISISNFGVHEGEGITILIT